MFHTFLNSALDRGKWSAFYPKHFILVPLEGEAGWASEPL